METRGIVTHTRPHLDEIAAIWLLREFGEEKYPGVSTAKIEFWTEGGATPDGRSADLWEAEGYILVGTGRGKFDEHPNHNGSSQSAKGECAATLVAKDLGIDEGNPALENILGFVKDKDLKAGSQPLDLPALVKLLHAQFPDQPEKVIEWAIMGLEAKYHEQVQFFQDTKKEFDEKAKLMMVESGGRTLTVVAIESDNEVMAKFARSSFGCKAAVVIQKHPSSGNAQIFTNKRFKLTLFDVAQMINLAEQEAEGGVKITDWKTLSAEGMIPGGRWFFHHAGQMLLNGSLTATDVPATRLSLEKITGIVRIGINPDIFEPEHALACKQGVCTSTRSNQCPWYAWGLNRCRKTRFDMRQK